MTCKETANGAFCEESIGSSKTECTPWQLTKSDEKEICFFSGLVEEHLQIGGADINVFKLLGIHEQGQLIDLAKNGYPISSGDISNFPVQNVFDIFNTEWRSVLKGQSIIDNGYIGYNFGEIKLDNDRLKYGIENANVIHNIATIKIKQSQYSKNRITKARIERSQDGDKWFGVSIITLPDDDNLNIINFKHSVPSRYWRIRPILFNGASTDHWAIKALELMDYDLTSIDDIQDEIFQENRDRDYSTESIKLKAQYDLLDTQSELTMFGIELPSQVFYLQLSFTACVKALNRPLVIGDIIEMPSEAQYNFNLDKIKKYLEITDVSWATDGYTPGYTPTMLRLMAQPMVASQETMDLFDNIADEVDDNGLSKYGLVNLEAGDKAGPVFQENEDVSQYIEAMAKAQTPEMGIDTSDTHIFSDLEISSAKAQGLNNLDVLNIPEKGVYIEDAMPPNGIKYTEGDILPDVATSKDGAYHRLTYSSDMNIPIRLFKYSAVKTRWLFMESDKRSQGSPVKNKLSEYYKSYNNPINTDSI